MSTHTERPWLDLYDKGAPPEIELDHPSALHMFARAAERAADRPAIRYFDAELTWADVDRLSDALAVGLHGLGIERGDRVGVYLQNVPAFLVAMVATWKAGAIMVSVNPMYRRRELEEILVDSGAVALVALESLFGDVAADVVGATDVRAVITTSERDLLDDSAPEPALLAGVAREHHAGTHDLLELTRRFAGRR